MDYTEKTTIQIKKSTVTRLKSYGKKGETYDDVLNRLLDGSNPQRIAYK